MNWFVNTGMELVTGPLKAAFNAFAAPLANKYVE